MSDPTSQLAAAGRLVLRPQGRESDHQYELIQKAEKLEENIPESVTKATPSHHLKKGKTGILAAVDCQ